MRGSGSDVWHHNVSECNDSAVFYSCSTDNGSSKWLWSFSVLAHVGRLQVQLRDVEKCLGGFILITDDQGNILYASENVCDYLRFSQVSTMLHYWLTKRQSNPTISAYHILD